MSNAWFYDDLSINKVKTPEIVEALQLELMVMSGPHLPELGFTSNQEIIETLNTPHHSLICIEDQENTQMSLPPLELNDFVAHALEESYTASTLGKPKWSTFLTFSCMSQSTECIYSTSSHSVA